MKHSGAILSFLCLTTNWMYFTNSLPIDEANDYCDLEKGAERNMAKPACQAYQRFGSCSGVTSIEQIILLKQCCACFKSFDLCCNETSTNTFAESTEESEKGRIIFPGLVQLSKQQDDLKAIRAGRRDKQDLKLNSTETKGTGTKNLTKPELDKTKISSPELHIIIKVAVNEALNKFANALKNATEGEETTEKAEDTTTVDPCLEFQSGASKSQVSSTKDIPKNCTESTALDEFFPIRNLATTKKRARRSYNFKVLPTLDARNPGSILKNRNRNGPELKMDYRNHESNGNPIDDPIWDTEDVPDEILPKQGKKMERFDLTKNSAVPALMSGTLKPMERPGKCKVLSETCIALGNDSANCKSDGECPGTKKCCFYGCPPNDKVGVCQIPVFL